MGGETKKRPALPRDVYRIDIRSLALVLYALGLFVLPAIYIGVLVEQGAELWLKLLLIPPLTLLVVHGGHMLGFVGHEGIHLILHPNKWVSTLVGSFLAAMTTFPALGYGISHWNHHRFTNQRSDPDAQVFPPFRTLLTRIICSRTAANRSYFRHTLAAARGIPLPTGYKLPFSRRHQRLLATLNLMFLAFWLSVYASLAIAFPLPTLFGLLIPMALLFPVSGLRAYVEHAGTGLGTFRDSRSYSSPVYTALFFGNNFHLEHHLYPSVPCYHLPEVHRYLARLGLLEAADDVHVDGTLLGPYRHTTAASQYPGPGRQNFDHDPFDRPVGGEA